MKFRDDTSPSISQIQLDLEHHLKSLQTWKGTTQNFDSERSDTWRQDLKKDIEDPLRKLFHEHCGMVQKIASAHREKILEWVKQSPTELKSKKDVARQLFHVQKVKKTCKLLCESATKLKNSIDFFAAQRLDLVNSTQEIDAHIQDVETCITHWATLDKTLSLIATNSPREKTADESSKYPTICSPEDLRRAVETAVTEVFRNNDKTDDDTPQKQKLEPESEPESDENLVYAYKLQLLQRLLKHVVHDPKGDSTAHKLRTLTLEAIRTRETEIGSLERMAKDISPLDSTLLPWKTQYVNTLAQTKFAIRSKDLTSLKTLLPNSNEGGPSFTSAKAPIPATEIESEIKSLAGYITKYIHHLGKDNDRSKIFEKQLLQLTPASETSF